MTANAAPLPADQPLWRPSAQSVMQSQMTAFITAAAKASGKAIGSYDELWAWSVADPAAFWSLAWDYTGVIGEKGAVALRDADKMPGAQFFPDGKINYAENLLRRRDDHPALIFRNEKGGESVYSFAQLYEQVSLWQQLFKSHGVSNGDRVAGYIPNMPQAIFAMLAAASLGVIWSSASPDFGTQGVLDRFGQVEPKILVAVDGYFYNGKTLDNLPRLAEIAAQLPSLKSVIVIPFASAAPDISGIAKSSLSTAALSAFKPAPVSFTRVAFNHPLFIMFSSGTTGAPKCIVHGHGGTLLQHLKEHRLHCDIRRDDRVFYFSTCGWMMWNWLASVLASEATLLLFDGAPTYPSPDALWEFTSRHQCTLFGTSAKYIDALKSMGFRPKDKFDLSSLRTLTSTGSPLVHESFDFIYDAIKSDLHLASISGGTDIISCFVLGNPLAPVWRGEIQCAGLGMDVTVADDSGNTMNAGAGELVCRKPFPSMPVMFWNDADGAKYKKAYFERFANTWCHGDWVERTIHGGYIIHGRSDATLNPGGVRIGTAEIYRQVEQVPQVLESIAVGQDWQGDVRVILFVRLRDGVTLDAALEKAIRDRIRTGASPRHVPTKIIAVADIPRTKSNKIVELAVRDIIHGRAIKNAEALANPQALELYKNLEALKS